MFCFVFVLQTAIDQFCPSFLKKEESKCTAQRYRQYNGLCNNLEHPYWGAALTAFRRMIPADYADGIVSSSFRRRILFYIHYKLFFPSRHQPAASLGQRQGPADDSSHFGRPPPRHGLPRSRSHRFPHLMGSGHRSRHDIHGRHQRSVRFRSNFRHST